jgi:hypothetical protein
MSIEAIIVRLDRLLEPFGFTRQIRAWNRKVASFIDVIDVQISKPVDRVTINAGVLDFDVHAILWGGRPLEFVEQPICTVGVRAGELVDGKDKWWQIDTPGVADELAESIAASVLPFFERMHTREAMRQWLIASDVVEKRYPPPIINLAILESFLGNTARSCAILAEFQTASAGAWRSRAAEVAKRLHCT